MKMELTNQLVIFGSAETASLAKFYFSNDSDLSVEAFTVDDDFVKEDHLEGLPIIPFSESVKRFPSENTPMHIALSYAQLNERRKTKYNQLKSLGYQLVSYVCSKSVTWPDLNHGDNCFILENQTIQPTVCIGNNVMIWSGNHLGHGSTIRDHSYISSHVVISGHCDIGERCFLGVNSTIKDFVKIGNECFVGMGASVTKDLKNGEIAVGGAARVIPEQDRLAKRLKKLYFDV
jgi:sugar O-acyltransferase (sialic acid O-acetyltransferase NeuD family)